MQKHKMDERTGISYTMIGDYYIPNLVAPDWAHEIGRFGRLHLKYLKEHRPLLHLNLLTSGGLNDYLHDIGVRAQEMFERLVKEYAACQGVTEELKADNQMEWVGRMNNIRSAVEEVVLSEIVYG